MFRRTLSIVLVLGVSCFGFADDEVSSWLKQMGCEKLLSAYLEEQLEEGDPVTKVRAAKELASLYAVLLSRATDGDDVETLKRATSLLELVPQATTLDLRIQLMRVSYLAAEQMLERYRLRFSDKSKADEAVTQLQIVADDLDGIRESLLRQARASRSQDEELAKRIGLTTSLLAWSHYYIAWHNNDRVAAEQAANFFAEILQGKRASLQLVSLDLKSQEFGARAILGIALCKDVIGAPSVARPWIVQLEDTATWESVRLQIPMWNFFLDIDHKRWNTVLLAMTQVKGVDQNLILRLAAMHALENPSDSEAKKVAKQAIAALVQNGQLGMVSEIVETHGAHALPSQGFIAKYIQGDLGYREAREEFPSDEPLHSPEVISRFQQVSHTLQRALAAPDAHEYPQLHDDCQFILGLAFFHASDFSEATMAFTNAAKGDQAERSMWMAIVSLEHIDDKKDAQQELLDQLVRIYVTSWPHSTRSTQLLLLENDTNQVTREHIEDLLSVPFSDPHHTTAQQQASKQLYILWGLADENDRLSIGNRYVSVATPLMLEDQALFHDIAAQERSVVRALRILEIALHHDVHRLVAAKRAFDVLDTLELNALLDIRKHDNEIAYRKVVAGLRSQDHATSLEITIDLIRSSPDTSWTTYATKTMLRHIAGKKITLSPHEQFVLGFHLLHNASDSEITSGSLLHVSKETMRAAFDIYLQNADSDAGNEAMRLARILIAAFPKSREILTLNAKIEHALGDSAAAIGHWRTIASGTALGSLPWLEARFHIINLVSQDAPQKALEILKQHHSLYPQYGVEPYGSKLRELHAQLRGGLDGS